MTDIDQAHHDVLKAKDAQIELLEARTRKNDRTIAILSGVLNASFWKDGRKQDMENVANAAVKKHLNELQSDSVLTVEIYRV